MDFKQKQSYHIKNSPYSQNQTHVYMQSYQQANFSSVPIPKNSFQNQGEFGFSVIPYQAQYDEQDTTISENSNNSFSSYQNNKIICQQIWLEADQKQEIQEKYHFDMSKYNQKINFNQEPFLKNPISPILQIHLEDVQNYYESPKGLKLTKKSQRQAKQIKQRLDISEFEGVFNSFENLIIQDLGQKRQNQQEINEKLKFQQDFDAMFSQLNEKENINSSKSDNNDDKYGKIKFKSAFKLFKLDKIAEVKKQNPNFDFRERTQFLKNLWKNLSADEKLQYVKSSRVEKQKQIKKIIKLKRAIEEKQRSENLQIQRTIDLIDDI